MDFNTLCGLGSGSVVCRMNEIALRWARLVLGWVTVFGRVYIPPQYVTKPTRSTQPCIPPVLLNRVPALISWGKGGNVTSAKCDPIWHVSSCSSEAVLNCYTSYLYPIKTGRNILSGITKFATLPQLCLYATWENVKTHKTAHFETNCQCILMLNAVNGNNESKWTVLSVCSKCPPSSCTQAAKRSLHWSIALSVICCSSSFQTVSRRCRSSSVFCVCSWYTRCSITDQTE